MLSNRLWRAGGAVLLATAGAGCIGRGGWNKPPASRDALTAASPQAVEKQAQAALERCRVLSEQDDKSGARRSAEAALVNESALS